MAEYRSILCCTDFSHNATLAFDEAAYLASISGARLTLLHVVHGGAGEAALAVPSDERAAEDALSVERMKREYVAPKGVDPQMIVRHGIIVAEILDAALDEEADLIVIGARGLTFWEGFIGGGSVAVKVVHHAPVSVLVVAPHKESEQKKGR